MHSNLFCIKRIWKSSRKYILRNAVFPYEEELMSYAVACLGHCVLLALTCLLSDIRVMTRTGWGLDLDSLLLGLKGTQIVHSA